MIDLFRSLWRLRRVRLIRGEGAPVEQCFRAEFKDTVEKLWVAARLIC